jgi:plastocyanin
MATRKLLPLALVLGLAAAACAEASHPEPQFGSGARFVPFVADPLNNAGVDPSVVVNAEGLPVIGYFGFEEAVEEGGFPQARPVTAPTLPGVLATTASAEGVWTRGAIGLQAQIPSVSVPFNPGFDEVIADLTADNVTGLQVVADGDTLHAVWGSRRGLYYASGSTDPASTTQFSIVQVGRTPPLGPSLAVVNGAPWIAYYTSMSETASVEVATPSGEAWSVEAIADAAGCDTCRTAVVAADGGPVVAYSDAGEGVFVAANDGESGWTSVGVGGGGRGLAGAATPDGVALSYYDGEQVSVATGPATGPFEVTVGASVAADSAADDGAGTAIAADDQGGLWLGWSDSSVGVGFASGDGGQFTPIETGAETLGGAMPSVAVVPEGSTAYLAWYDTVTQDLLVGAYGELEDLAIAVPSPEPGPPAQETGAPPAGDCVEPVDGVVTITAQGIAFDAPCVTVPAGEPVQIEFVNNDAGVQHNVAIYPSAEEVTPDAAFLVGEIFAGAATQTYEVPAIDAGEYYFQCDVHPNMNGVWNVVEGGGGGGGGETGATGATGATGGATGGTGATGATGGGGGLTVVAAALAFDTSTIELPADTATTITFDNQDSGVQHNISIYRDETLSEVLFQGELITGPGVVEYAIEALPAGEYYFQCDVHPTMNGTVVVA